MAYATGTINSVNPGRDMMAALQPTLLAGGLQLVETYQSPVANNWNLCAYGAGLFVAFVAGTSTVVTSPDGVTWTQRNLPASLNWSAVTYGGGQFVAIAVNSLSYVTSPDGITWTVKGTFPISGTFTALAYGAGQFVAVQSATTNVVVSTDGTTWQTKVNQAGTYSYTSMTYANGLFVCVATGGSAATSPDAVTWTWRNLISVSSFTSVAYGAGVWVAVNTNGNGVYAYSVDGLTWQSKPIASVVLKSVTFGNGLFVAVGSANGNIYTSPDGLNWTPRPVANAAASMIAFGNSTFVAPLYPGSAADVSTDGISWNARNLPGTSNNPTADVYRSPAASNTAGQDWYLVLRRSTDNNTGMFYQVAESYDAVNHLLSRYGGIAQTIMPAAATGWVNTAAAMAPDAAAAFGLQALVLLNSGAVVPYYISVTADRVVFGSKSGTEYGFYAGLYEDMLPAGTTAIALGCTKLPNSTPAAAGSIGGNNAIGAGGFTREPAATTATALNFEAVIWNTWLISTANAAASFIGVAFGLMTDTGALYGNTNSLARVPIGTARSANGNSANAIRGLLIGVVMSQVSALIGDTITAGTKTYVRFGGPTATVGYFVDSGL